MIVLNCNLVMFLFSSFEKEEEQDKDDIEVPTLLFEVWFVSCNIGL